MKLLLRQSHGFTNQNGFIFIAQDGWSNLTKKMIHNIGYQNAGKYRNINSKLGYKSARSSTVNSRFIDS